MDFFWTCTMLQVLPKLYKANTHRLLKTCDFKIFHICLISCGQFNNTTTTWSENIRPTNHHNDPKRGRLTSQRNTVNDFFFFFYQLIINQRLSENILTTRLWVSVFLVCSKTILSHVGVWVLDRSDSSVADEIWRQNVCQLCEEKVSVGRDDIWRTGDSTQAEGKHGEEKSGDVQMEEVTNNLRQSDRRWHFHQFLL